MRNRNKVIDWEQHYVEVGKFFFLNMKRLAKARKQREHVGLTQPNTQEYNMGEL